MRTSRPTRFGWLSANRTAVPPPTCRIEPGAASRMPSATAWKSLISFSHSTPSACAVRLMEKRQGWLVSSNVSAPVTGPATAKAARAGCFPIVPR